MDLKKQNESTDGAPLEYEDLDSTTVAVYEIECVKETPKALFVKQADEITAWIPKSVICSDSEVTAEGDMGMLTVKRWFAEKNW